MAGVEARDAAAPARDIEDVAYLAVGDAADAPRRRGLPMRAAKVLALAAAALALASAGLAAIRRSPLGPAEVNTAFGAETIEEFGAKHVVPTASTTTAPPWSPIFPAWRPRSSKETKKDEKFDKNDEKDAQGRNKKDDKKDEKDGNKKEYGSLLDRFKREPAGSTNFLKARLSYRHSTAQAFAALAKLSYCGPLPGLYASVPQTCQKKPLLMPQVKETSCQHAHFEAVPGFVRSVAAYDDGVYAAVFGYVVQVRPFDKWSSVHPGCVVAFRGSTDNKVNGQRDQETDFVGFGHSNTCWGCKVHSGYAKMYDLIKSELVTNLGSAGCPSGSQLYFTGHGSGAALAQLAMHDLARAGWSMNASYLFESPKVGNAHFAEQMNREFLDSGKFIYSTAHRNDEIPRWPAHGSQVGYQVYYPGVASKIFQICKPNANCGINKVKARFLTTKDTCPSPLAPDDTFCEFSRYEDSCYLGMGFEAKYLAPALEDLETETNPDGTVTVKGNISKTVTKIMNPSSHSSTEPSQLVSTKTDASKGRGKKDNGKKEQSHS